jgi:hypothetical protein
MWYELSGPHLTQLASGIDGSGQLGDMTNSTPVHIQVCGTQAGAARQLLSGWEFLPSSTKPFSLSP